MNILLTGATGFMGHALADALLAAGHQLTCVVRDPARLALRERWPAERCTVVVMDVAKAYGMDDWRAVVASVDAVINAVGIFRESAAQSFDALHTRAPIALFDAAAEVGVRCVVQISALGADAKAQSAFHLSKRAADDHLRALGLQAWVLQPSLVYGPGGASAQFFNVLATLPAWVLPRLGDAQVQPVLLDDVVQGVVNALAAVTSGHAPQAAQCRTVALVGPQAMPLADYLTHLRQALGWRLPGHRVEVPLSWLRALTTAMQRLPGSGFLDSDALAMLARGNSADSRPFAQLLGREPTPVQGFIPPGLSQALRHAAVLALWLPLLRLCVALVWLWTGVVSLGLYPVQDSLALLARVGAQGATAWLLLYGAALLDVALGVATLVLPGRWRRPLWAVQVLLIGSYTALISWRLPGFWLHPYGPILKNIPLLAAIGLLWSLESPAGPRARASTFRRS